MDVRKRLHNKKITILSRISPTLSTKQVYSYHMERKLNLKNPRYFCEKLHYLKLNDYYNNPLVTACIDKYTVKQYMKSLGFENMCAKLYGVYGNAEDIEWGKLPDKFIVKCTHGSGYNIVCKDKMLFDYKKAEKQLKKWMKEDLWVKYAETQYRFVKKRIIVEEYLGDNLLTYRFCCFNGKPKLIYIMEKDSVVFFDSTWKKLNYRCVGIKEDNKVYDKPRELDQMLTISEKLSGDYPFVRIDLYLINNKIYFSEFTFIPAGGIMRFENKNIARMLGSWIEIGK